MRILSKIISTFFGAGYFPVAPGTVTSLMIVFLYKLVLHKLSWPLYFLLLIFVFAIGTLTSGKYSSEITKKDPQNIVIDEAFGQMLVLFQMSTNWLLLLLSFFLFRIFDIIKPYPIRRVEEFPGGWGIMMDDLIAAVYAGVVIYVYLILR